MSYAEVERPFPMNLQGKVVLITGASGGLGTVVTQTFLDAGATVAGVARKISASEFPSPSFTAIQADISSLAQAQSVVAQLPRVDALVHLVGAFAGGKPVEETDDATLEKMFDLNFRTAFHFIRAVLPGMKQRKSGAIVAIGSKVAESPAATLSAYSISKAALVSLIRTVALENKESGVTANVVLPGTMDTPANRQAMPQADPSRWVQPAQVAAMLLHLVSSQASQINGAVIPIYGAEL
jgi:NAD(P)-dependent dehydrogenase (short-subunit alcohol dehydrogenase family)